MSTVVPVYNDRIGIEKTLDCLLDQTYPIDAHEILVVDNASTDDTRAIVQRYADSYDHVRLLVEDEIRSPAAARNTGIQSSNGEILAFVDSDMLVPPDHLDRGTALMKARGVDYLACNVEPYTHGEPSLIERYNESFGFPVERYFEEQRFGITGGLFVSASVFRTVGAFDDRLISSEDEEFGRRVYRSGIDQAFAPDLTVYHPTRSSIRAMAEKHVRTGRGYYRLRQRYPDRYGPPQSAFSPRRVLPLRLGPLRERCRGWDRLSTFEKVAFYLIAFLCKLSSTYGSIREVSGLADDIRVKSNPDCDRSER